MLFASRVRFEVVHDGNGEEEDGGDEKKVRVEAEGKKTATALVASRVKFEVDP